jgi:hypothetical protein
LQSAFLLPAAFLPAGSIASIDPPHQKKRLALPFSPPL